jgi:hypothetical protein
VATSSTQPLLLAVVAGGLLFARGAAADVPLEYVDAGSRSIDFASPHLELLAAQSRHGRPLPSFVLGVRWAPVDLSIAGAQRVRGNVSRTVLGVALPIYGELHRFALFGGFT